MPKGKTQSGTEKKSNGANVGYEAELWQIADALRGSMGASEYKHVILGFIFLSIKEPRRHPEPKTRTG